MELVKQHLCQVTAKTKQYVDCPNCKEDHFSVGHMGNMNDWEWDCNKCGHFFKFSWTENHEQLRLTPVSPKHTRALALVKYVGSSTNHELYFIVETIHRYGPDGSYDRNKAMESDRYYIEEHTCPTNLVYCNAIIYNGNSDPHGVLQYVRSATIMDICAELNITKEELLDTNNDFMFQYFPECKVMTNSQ